MLFVRWLLAEAMGNWKTFGLSSLTHAHHAEYSWAQCTWHIHTQHSPFLAMHWCWTWIVSHRYPHVWWSMLNSLGWYWNDWLVERICRMQPINLSSICRSKWHSIRVWQPLSTYTKRDIRIKINVIGRSKIKSHVVHKRDITSVVLYTLIESYTTHMGKDIHWTWSNLLSWSFLFYSKNSTYNMSGGNTNQQLIKDGSCVSRSV